MWTLKDDVEIIVKKHGLKITRQSLAKNQGLADVVLGDDYLFRKYGHNFVEVGSGKQAPAPKQEEVVIEVNIKKKADALTESKEPVSTSTEVLNDGNQSGTNSLEPELKSEDTKHMNRKQRREKLKEQKSGVSEVTKG